MTISFRTIRARAEKRKGGAKALNRLLPERPDPKTLTKLGDDRVLAEMTRRVFSAGFAWNVIEAKWAGPLSLVMSNSAKVYSTSS